MADKKVKKMIEGKEVVLAKAKEVDFGDIELKIAKPVLNTDKTLSIGGNFSEVGAKIQAVVDRYKETKLTEDNVDYVKTLKKQFVSLRTGIDRERKEYMKVYITPAKDLVDSMCKELLAIVDAGESTLGKQLDEYDQRRKNELTVILKEYVAEAVEKYNLRDEYSTQIQLIDKYYNKTQNEEDSIADIDNQAKELAKKQSEHDAGVQLITSECEDAGFLPDTYIRELEYKSAMEIVLEIKKDKKVSAEMKEKEESGQKIEVGEAVDEELKKAMEAVKPSGNEDRTRVLRITYKAENAKKIAKAMAELCVKFEFIKEDF